MSGVHLWHSVDDVMMRVFITRLFWLISWKFAVNGITNVFESDHLKVEQNERFG